MDVYIVGRGGGIGRAWAFRVEGRAFESQLSQASDL